MTKIFCDIADIKLIKKFTKKKIVKGFTTNPSLIRKAGAKNYSKYCKDILKITKKPISFEVFADDYKNIIKQALKIKDWGNQIYVKVPVNNSKGIFLGLLFSSYIIGIGQPQYLCLDTPQSLSLKLTFFFPNLFFSKYSIVFGIESSGHFKPSKNWELKILPGPV